MTQIPTSLNTVKPTVSDSISDESITVLQGQPLAPLTTIGIGGDARYLIEAFTVEDLQGALAWAKARQVPVLILGGGSNVLVSDNGWSGLVILMRIAGFDVAEIGDATVEVVAGAGESWDQLVQLSVDHQLQGLECLSGIPGTVGASPIQNIGAYGQEVKDTIAWVEALDRSTAELRRFNAAECEFAYRWSRFKGVDRDCYVVTRVAFHLKKNTSPTVRYGDLTRYFDEHKIEKPSLAQTRDAVLAVRRSKGMVVDAAIPDSRSCGSFFMNPIVSNEEAEKIRHVMVHNKLLDPNEKLPGYPANPGHTKLSAAYLMEKSGLKKGFRLGNVGLSTRHVLALINCGDGTSAEVLVLVDHVKTQVSRQFGVELRPEPVFVGFDGSDIVDGGGE